MVAEFSQLTSGFLPNLRQWALFAEGGSGEAMESQIGKTKYALLIAI